MNDDDITKLATKLSESLATKDDLKNLATKKDLEQLEHKVDVILEFATAIEETTSDHEKRLKKLESTPSITA